ncbi:DUF2306 domain-containing protein [Sphingomonas sp. RS6]
MWISSAIFALYILAFYVGAVATGTPDDWNRTLPRLHVSRSWLANVGIGAHFALGAVLLLFGPVQLFAGVRRRWPQIHRWTGRLYLFAALVTGIGGLIFIVARGTVGGWVMDVGFGLYGILMIGAAAQTLRFAMMRQILQHRAWAVRLFALAIGSWLYRMDYGFWFLFAGRLGHTSQFDGWFDAIMIFWFYLPNLIIAELFLRARRPTTPPGVKIAAAAGMAGATLFLLLATYFFTAQVWLPGMLWRAGAAPS